MKARVTDARPPRVGGNELVIPSGLRKDVDSGNRRGTLQELAPAPDWRVQASKRPFVDSSDDIQEMTEIESLLHAIYGQNVGADEADELQQNLAWCEIMLKLAAPKIDHAAARLKEKGLIEPGAGGSLKRCKDPDGQDRKGRWETKAGQGKVLSEKLGKKVRPHRRSHGHTLGTGGFLTTDKHARNYGLGEMGAIEKGAALIAGDSTAPGVGDVVSLITVPVHAAFIANVRNNHEALNEKARMGVVLGLRNAVACLATMRRGELPSPALMQPWFQFWNDVVGWDKTAKIAVAVMKASAKDPTAPHLAVEQLPGMLADKRLGDQTQTRVGEWRDCKGAVPLELYALARGIDYLAGLDFAGFLGPIAVLAGFADIKQGHSESKVAGMAKALARWRQHGLRDELANLDDDHAEHKEVLESLIKMFGDEKQRADYESVSAEVRKFYGMTRIVSGGLMTTGVIAPPLAPVVVPIGVFAGLLGQAVSGAVLGLRQYLRWCKTHKLKATERDYRHWLAIHGGGNPNERQKALTTQFKEGFSVERSVGDLHDGQEGLAHVHEARYEPGMNEIMALEIMARDIVIHQASAQEGESYFMGMLDRRLGLPPINKLFVRSCVQEFLYHDQVEAAIEFVSGVVRKLLEAPASRATEPVRPDAFVSTFESARQRAWLRLPDDDPREQTQVPLELLEQEFFAPRGDGTAIDELAFSRSMEALRDAWNTKYTKVERTGVYADMLAFHEGMKAHKRAPSRIAVHLERWQEWAMLFPKNGAPHAEHQALARLLRQATQCSGTTWQAQLKAAVQASDKPLKRCGSLIKSLRKLADADADADADPDVAMPPFVARFASELRLELRSIAADIGKLAESQPLDRSNKAIPRATPTLVSLRQQWLMPKALLVDSELKEAHGAVEKELDRASKFRGETWQDQLRNSLLTPAVRRQDCESLLARIDLLDRSVARESPGVTSVIEELKQTLQRLATDFRWLDVNAFDAGVWALAWKQMKTPDAPKETFAREKRLVERLLDQLEQLEEGPEKSLEERLPAALRQMERADLPRRLLVPALREALAHFRVLPEKELPWFQKEMTILLEQALPRATSH